MASSTKPREMNSSTSASTRWRSAGTALSAPAFAATADRRKGGAGGGEATFRGVTRAAAGLAATGAGFAGGADSRCGRDRLARRRSGRGGASGSGSSRESAASSSKEIDSSASNDGAGASGAGASSIDLPARPGFDDRDLRRLLVEELPGQLVSARVSEVELGQTCPALVRDVERRPVEAGLFHLEGDFLVRGFLLGLEGRDRPGSGRRPEAGSAGPWVPGPRWEAEAAPQPSGTGPRLRLRLARRRPRSPSGGGPRPWRGAARRPCRSGPSP